MPAKRTPTPQPPKASQGSTDQVRVTLICEGWPSNRFEGFDGRNDIHATLQTKDSHEPGTPAGRNAVKWTTEIIAKTAADGSIDFAGSAVHGKRGERFFYLSWSGVKNGHREMFRRIKIHLRDVTTADLSHVAKKGGTLVARVNAVAKDGGPACASVPILGGWSVQES